ncbi:MAG: glycosyltransferase family 2 protein [Sedimentisphaeraceae bacterium JB056]
MAVEVSIVMRSCNDIEYIGKTLEMVFKQNFTDFELINVDCSSTDGTYDIVKKYNPDKSYQILQSDYVPGRVLNDAIGKCSGRIVVFNNSDCVPCDENWLGNLIKPLQNGEAIASYGCQLPREDAHPLVRKDNLRAFSSIGQSWFHFFSLATSAIIREELIRHPFDNDIQYSEDIYWSYKARERGCKIAFAKDSAVEHSHNYTFPQIKKRFYGEGFAEGAIYGSRGVEDTFLMKVIKPFIAETLRDVVYLIKTAKPHLIFYAPFYRWKQKYWVYKGLKDYFKSSDKKQV